MKYDDVLQEIQHLLITLPDAEIDTQLVVEHLRLDPYSVDGRVLVEYVHDAMLDMAIELLQHSQERIRRSRKRTWILGVQRCVVRYGEGKPSCRVACEAVGGAVKVKLRSSGVL